jgi:hypothetical protein
MKFKKIPDSGKDFTASGSVTYRGAELVNGLTRDERVLALRIPVKATITSTANFAGGMPAAAETALLNTFISTFTVLSGSTEHKLVPYKDETGVEMRRNHKRLLELPLVGEGDSTTGLDKPLVIGSNEVTFALYLPLGYAETVAESKLIGGLGAEQLSLCELKLKGEGEPLAAVDPALRLTRFEVEYLEAGVEQGNGSHIGVPVTVMREQTNAGKAALASLPPCFPLFIDYDKRPLATADIGRYELRVGNVVVVDDSKTPATVFRDYQALPDVGALEESVSTEVTPLHSTPDTSFKAMVSGTPILEMYSKPAGVEWDVSLTAYLATSEGHMRETLMALAGARPRGRSVLAVNAAALYQLNVEPRHFAVCGAVVFEDSERQYYRYPGLKCVSGGKPEVEIPDEYLERAARLLVKARQATNPDQRKLMAELAYREVADWVPTATASVRGYDGDTDALVDIRQRVEAQADLLEQAEALVRARLA